MVVKQTSQKKVVVRRNYTVEKRVHKDAFWYQGWFSSLVPEWSEWEPVYSYTKVKHAGEMYLTLEKNKAYNKVKTEYRFIKEPENQE